MHKAPRQGGDRKSRLSSLLERRLAEYFKLELDLPGLVSISHIDVDSTMQNAVVWLSIYGAPEEDVLRTIVKARKSIHAYLIKELRTKYVPRIKFTADPSEAHAQRINEAFRDLEEE